jgi:hypothetical protein
VCVCMHVCQIVCMYVCWIVCVCVCMYVGLCVYVYVCIQGIGSPRGSRYRFWTPLMEFERHYLRDLSLDCVCMYACMSDCVYVCVLDCVCMCMYVCWIVCVCVCMYPRDRLALRQPLQILDSSNGV